MRLTLLPAVVLLLGSLASCTSSQTAAEMSAPMSAASNSSFSLAPLVGRNIDQVRRSLGTPRETKDQKIGLEPNAEQLSLTKGEDWVNTFDRNGTTIVATFNARTRKVRDLVVIGSDEDELLRRTNLSLTASDYSVQPIVNPKDATQTIGLRVTNRN